jgi:hypothetical protein
MKRRDIALVLPGRDDEEVWLSLHPISLLLVLAEALEDGGRALCRRRGHTGGETEEGHCPRCGTSLPDRGGPYGSWFPPAYRSIRGGKS